MSNSLKIVYSSFFAFLLANIIENKLKILRRSPKINLILSTVKLIVHDFNDLFINEDVAINYVKHIL